MFSDCLVSQRRQALVFGITLYGGMAGYGLSFLFLKARHVMSWRWWYVLCGGAGIILAVAFLFAVDPANETNQRKQVGLKSVIPMLS